MSLNSLFSDTKSMPQKQRRKWVVAFFSGLFIAFAVCLLPIEKIAVLIILLLGCLVYLPSMVKLTQIQDLQYIAKAPLSSLDERQQQVRLKASEYAYNFMIAIVSGLALYFSLSGAFQVYFLKIQSASGLIVTSYTFVLFFRLALIAWLEPDPIADEVLSSVG